MAKSSRYREMAKAVVACRQALLPSTFHPTGTYRNPKNTHFRSVSFRILVHAEIEAYLEDRALEVLTAAWAHWKSTRTPSETVICLLGFSEVALEAPPKDLATNQKNPKKDSHIDINKTLQKSIDYFYHVLTHNHGIKESNVLSLILPLGVEHTRLDVTLLADLTSYGSLRGEVAHSSKSKIKKFADPKLEYNKAKQLIKDLEKLDVIFNQLIARADRLARP